MEKIKRLEGYQNLIEQLLNCAISEEAEILRVNRHLIAPGLVQTMLKMAGDISSVEPDRANRLMNIAGALMGAGGSSATTISSQTYFDFLMEILGEIHDNGNGKNLDGLLGANLHLLDKNLAQELLKFATESFAEFEPELKQRMALDILALSQLMGEFPLNRGNNLEIAIAGWEICSTIYTRQEFPEIWATIQHQLGTAYRDRICDDKTANLIAAIHHYQAALAIRTRQAFPHSYLETIFNLGIAYESMEKLLDAFGALSLAIDTLESLRGKYEMNSNPYDWIVKVCVKLAQTEPEYADKAIEFIERSKARDLVESLLEQNNFYPKRYLYKNQNQYQKTCYQLDELRRQIPLKQQQLNELNNWRSLSQNRANWLRVQQELNALQQQWNTLQKEINSIDPRFKSTQQVEPIAFNQIQSLTAPNTAIIEWYITNDKIVTSIALPQTAHAVVLESSSNEVNALVAMHQEYINAYSHHQEIWHNQLSHYLVRLARILHIDRILACIPTTCDRLILIPHSHLQIFPLHALPQSDRSDRCLLDRFARGVGYAPSCQLLQLNDEQQNYSFSHLFAVCDRTNDLAYAEVAAIESFFSSHEVLVKQAADEAAVMVNGNLSQAHCLHFCCSGELNLNLPLESGLILAKLADNEEIRLTLAQLFRLNLDRCRLVMLSACGLAANSPSLKDTSIDWACGFLYAGTSSVVSSLWNIDDLATIFLICRFYQEIKKHHILEAREVAAALGEAQKWLRNLTSGECETIFNQLKPQIERSLASLTRKERKLVISTIETAMKKIRDRRPYPFAHPYYWAGFKATGH